MTFGPSRAGAAPFEHGDMRVLVVESEPGSGNDALAPLAAAGHQLCRCQEPGTVGFGCRGFERPRACPIAAGVDVAVAIRWVVR